MIERWKITVIVIKYKRAKGRISLSGNEIENYENDTRNKRNLDQVNNKYLL